MTQHSLDQDFHRMNIHENRKQLSPPIARKPQPGPQSSVYRSGPAPYRGGYPDNKEEFPPPPPPTTYMDNHNFPPPPPEPKENIYHEIQDDDFPPPPPTGGGPVGEYRGPEGQVRTSAGYVQQPGYAGAPMTSYESRHESQTVVQPSGRYEREVKQATYAIQSSDSSGRSSPYGSQYANYSTSSAISQNYSSGGGGGPPGPPGPGPASYGSFPASKPGNSSPVPRYSQNSPRASEGSGVVYADLADTGVTYAQIAPRSERPTPGPQVPVQVRISDSNSSGYLSPSRSQPGPPGPPRSSPGQQQYASSPAGQQYSSSAGQQYSSAQYSTSPGQQYSSAPSQQYSSAPSQQQYSSAPNQQYASSPQGQQYSTAPGQQQNTSSTGVQYSSPAGQQYSSAPGQQFATAPGQQFSAAPGQQFVSPSPAQYSSALSSKSEPAQGVDKEKEVDALTQMLMQGLEGTKDPEFFGICSKCGMKVLGETNGCTAMDQIFHIQCFICVGCGSQLRGKSFYAMERKPYCETCYVNSLERCSVCSKPITDRLLRATGKPYHPACFVCVVCGKSLDGVPFTVDATNQIHCIEDFHKKFAPRCCVCQHPIMPAKGQEETVRVVAMDRSFHVECYRCEDCNLRLSSEAEGRGCYPLDDHILCKNCNAKRINALTTKLSTEL